MRTCTICGHADRSDIEMALLDGQSLRNVAKRFSVGTTSLHRHKKAGHVAQSLVKAKEVEVELMGETLFDRLRSINAETTRILQEAKGSPGLELSAIHRIERQIELEAKILGQLDEKSVKVAIGFNLTPPEPEFDLGALTLDELDELERLSMKIRGLSE